MIPSIQHFIRHRWSPPLFCWLALLLLTSASVHAQIQTAVIEGTTNASKSMATGDVLEFSDGSILHGSLSEMNRDTGIRWNHPDLLKDADFRPDNLQKIRFPSKPSPVKQVPMPNRLRFRNGDELFGELLSLDETAARLNTRFGKNLRVERSALESITFLAKHFSVLYEGPSGLEGWSSGRGGHAWKYREGSFTTEHVGSIGRNLELPPASSIEFEIAWEGQLGMIVQAYTDNVDRFDYSSASYMFYINANSIGLQRVSPETGISNLGNVPLPETARKNNFRLEVRASKEEATLAVYVDGVLLNKWKDSSGFSGKGSGVLFFSQHEGPKLKLGNLKVSEWDGKFEDNRAEELVRDHDILHLANRDKVDGKVLGINDGKLRISTPETPLEIPLARLTQIQFASSKTAQDRQSPWLVRAALGGGEKLSFTLDKWTAESVSGTNSSFGRIEFSPSNIRQLDFNFAGSNSKMASGSDSVTDSFPDASQSASSALPGSNDALLLRNGDVLLGTLKKLNPETALTWSREDSLNPLDFKPAAISEVRLRQNQKRTTNNCEITFVNGSQLSGKLVSISDSKVLLDTWYAGRLSLPRASVLMIVPLQEDRTPIFAGPGGLEDWAMGNITAVNDAGQWTYQNGAFYASKAASVARNVNLPDVASIQFDIAWKGTLQMAVALYSDRLQPINLANKDVEPDFGGFYSLQLGSLSAGLLMVKKGAPINYLWQMSTPLLSQKNQAHVEVRANKGKKSVTLMIDGVVVKEAVDSEGFAGTGQALRFVHQGHGTLRLSNLKVTEWDGLFEEPYSNKAGTEELIRLRNGDRVTGKIEQFENSKLVINTDGSKLEIPWQRVKQLEQHGKMLTADKNEPATALGYFMSGAPLKFDLERWDDKGIHVNSSQFGKAVFDPTVFQRIRFNFKN
ncbi:MAG: hypothetical protein H0X66_17615 [Verrucomicrobia bacterium]|nr:hypothetical protein [Verrucomicrobiota bacterium]